MQEDKLVQQLGKLSIQQPKFLELTEVTPQIVEDVKKVIEMLRKNHENEPYFTINFEQKSDQWLQERSIRLTGSNFKKYARARPQTRLKLAHTNINNSQKHISSAAMTYGNNNEHKARDYYQQLYPDLRIEESTLTIRTKQPWIGASPDGLVLDKEGKLIGAVEIKCPFSKKDMTLDHAIDTTDFYLKRSGDSIILDKNHEYYYQIQGQMMVLDLDWVDFVVRTEKDVKIVRIDRNQQFIDDLKKELKQLYFENYIWEVIKHYVRPSYMDKNDIYYMKRGTAEKLFSQL